MSLPSTNSTALKSLYSTSTTTNIPITTFSPPSTKIYHLLTIPPLHPPHLQTIILLHGSGDTGSNFGPPLLLTGPLPHPPSLTPITPSSFFPTFRSAFPNASFIFPTAPTRTLARYSPDQKLTRWFDWWSLDDDFLSERSEIQREGLKETRALIKELVDGEVRDGRKVVIGGLSNGGAVTLGSLLMDGELAKKVDAVVGMCAWVPFEEGVKGEVKGGRDGVERWVRGEVGVEGERGIMGSVSTPVFLGHGMEDWVVPVERSVQAEGILKELGFEVEGRRYEGLEHWYSEEMLGDLVSWLRGKLAIDS